jgi:hypothetical protein
MKPFIVCDGTTEPCTYLHLLELAQVIIHNLVVISTFVAVAVFIFAGFKMMTSGGSEGEYKKAVGMFTKVGMGYVWILVAWLIVYTISKALLSSGFSILEGIK